MVRSNKMVHRIPAHIEQHFRTGTVMNVCSRFQVGQRRVPGLGQITWQIVLTKKIRDNSGGEIARKSRNSWRVSSGDVGAHGQLTRGQNGPSPGTKYKRSRNVFAVTPIAISLGHFRQRLLDLPAQSLTGSPSTLAKSPNDSTMIP